MTSDRIVQWRWLLALTALCTIAAHAQPLPSWNDGPAKQAILKFVDEVTTPGSPSLVAIATDKESNWLPTAKDGMFNSLFCGRPPLHRC